MTLKPIVLILCGPPASGKSSYVRTLPPHFVSISRDEIREKLYGKLYKQNNSDEKKVTKVFDNILEIAINKGQEIVIDKCNVDEAHLDEYVKQFPTDKFILCIKFFNAPLWLCKLREVKRRVFAGRHVPHAVIEDMKTRFDKINQQKYFKYKI